MKNVSILTIIISILTFSSCEEDVDFVIGCMDSEALNYDSSATEDDDSCEYASLSVSEQIVGSWTIDSSYVNMMLNQEMFDLLMMMSIQMSPKEFEDEIGFPMPNSQAEWDELALNGITQDGELYGSILITNSTFTVDDLKEVTELEYQLVNDETIEFLNPDEQFEYFDIVQVSETNLVITTNVSEEEDGMAVDYMVMVFLSK